MMSPRLELQALGRGLAVAQHMTFGHKGLQRTAGEAGVLAAQKAVDALARTLGFDDKFTLFHGSLLLCAVLVQLLQKDDQHPERHAHTDADIREVEDGEAHEQHVDVIHDLAVQHPVD